MSKTKEKSGCLVLRSERLNLSLTGVRLRDVARFEEGLVGHSPPIPIRSGPVEVRASSDGESSCIKFSGLPFGASVKWVGTQEESAVDTPHDPSTVSVGAQIALAMLPRAIPEKGDQDLWPLYLAIKRETSALADIKRSLILVEMQRLLEACDMLVMAIEDRVGEIRSGGWDHGKVAENE